MVVILAREVQANLTKLIRKSPSFNIEHLMTHIDAHPGN
jgi:hypothetical protein